MFIRGKIESDREIHPKVLQFGKPLFRKRPDGTWEDLETGLTIEVEEWTIGDLAEEVEMPIGTLRYKLPEEESDFRLAQNAWKYKSVLIDISNDLRAKEKYGSEEMPPKTWGEFREYFWKMLELGECPDIHSEED